MKKAKLRPVVLVLLSSMLGAWGLQKLTESQVLSPSFSLGLKNDTEPHKSGSFASFASEIASKQTAVDISIIGRSKRSTRVKRAVSSLSLKYTTSIVAFSQMFGVVQTFNVW